MGYKWVNITFISSIKNNRHVQDYVSVEFDAFSIHLML